MQQKQIIYSVFLLLLLMIVSCNNKNKTQELVYPSVDTQPNKYLEKATENKLCEQDSSLIFIIETIKAVSNKWNLDLKMDIVSPEEIRTPLNSYKGSDYSILEYFFLHRK